jgi:four helix bundle protein
MYIKSYRDLIVWQKSMNVVVEIYKLTENFPRTETYGLISQMRRASVSMPSNIAEGTRRVSKKDMRHFLAIAYGSGMELETQIELSKRLEFGKIDDYKKIDSYLSESLKILNKMTRNTNY